MSDDRHWSETAPSEPSPVPEARPSAAPRPALGAVAQRIAEVSPAWKAVTIDPAAAPSTTASAELGRDRERGVESIREGWLLHRGASRLAAAASPDLALLVGDWCYAAGLCTISDHGSLEDVAALARLVADVSARCDQPIDALEARWTDTLDVLARGGS